MKYSKALMVCALVLNCAFAPAQSPAVFIRKAMAACGPWEQVSNFYYANSRVNINKWQAFSFTRPKPTNNSAELYLDLKNGKFHNRSIFHSAGGYIFEFVFIGKDSTRFIYDRNMSRNGKLLLKQGKDGFLATINQGFQNIPYFILQTIATTKDSLHYKETSGEVSITRFIKGAGTQEFLFDASNLQLKRITRITGQQKSERFFERHKQFDGLHIPVIIRQLVDGNFALADSVTAFRSNVVIDTSLYVIPAKYALQAPAAPKPLSAKEIAKDVFLVEEVAGDRNIVFVSMQDYIVVTEAPVSSEITKSVIDLIHRTVPGKPIKYVHLSHFHNDHAAGIRQLVSEGAAIICTPQTELPVKAILKGELGAVSDDYAKNPKEAVFELFSRSKVMEDGNHRIEFRAVPNSHADGLSFMYLPEEGIIYQGDLLSIPADGTLTPAIRVNREFNSYLQKNKIKYSRIIGHHNYSNITPGMFAKMLQMK